jgi:hypothetical protein
MLSSPSAPAGSVSKYLTTNFAQLRRLGAGIDCDNWHYRSHEVKLADGPAGQIYQPGAG